MFTYCWCFFAGAESVSPSAGGFFFLKPTITETMATKVPPPRILATLSLALAPLIAFNFTAFDYPINQVRPKLGQIS